MKTILLNSKAIKNLIISDNLAVLEVLDVIEKGGHRIALVVNSSGLFKGIVTDYDVRRAIIKFQSLNFDTSSAINSNPIVALKSLSISEQLSLIDKNNIEHLPIIDDAGCLVGLRLRSAGLDLIHPNTVVIMAGGLGKRLHPLTLKTPKPMLKIWDKPILEIIIDRYKAQGFKNFVISVNYLSDIITGYFEDGASRDISISYIYESNKRGTIGSLSELSKIPNIKFPIILSNGDIICTTKFKDMIDFHTKNKFDVTVCGKNYSVEIPYGVLEENNSLLTGLSEKPNLSMNINSGIYVLNKSAVDEIPDNIPYDATTLISKLLDSSKRVGVHQIQDLWLDVGNKEDLKRFEDLI